MPMSTIDLAAFTPEYLINTWLQPGDFASTVHDSFTALKRGVSEKSARKKVAMNSSPTKLPYAAAEIFGRSRDGE